ncbi:MAG: diguanylate cyclase (GGDEF)-like protein/PAS domain S-box-containing protein [Desulforhopalus sp.]
MSILSLPIACKNKIQRELKMEKALPCDAVTKIQQLEKEIEALTRQSEDKIKTSLAKYRRLLDATSEGFLELDLEFKIVDYNATIVELTGISGTDLMYSSVNDLYDKQSVFVHFASKNHLSFEAVIHSQTGKYIPLLFKRSILRDKKGLPNGYLVFLTELTELKKAQEDRKQAEAQYRNIYQNAAQGMYQCTLEGNLLRVNPAFAKIFGYEQATQLISSVRDISILYKDKNDRDQLLSDLKKNRIITNYEVEMQDRDGKPIWALINARLTDGTDGPHLIDGILINNTKKRLAEDQLRKSRERFRYLANHDSLTGLFNTRYLYKTLDKMITKSNELKEPFSLVFLDMDNFKHVVDTYGHLNGSQALKEVAETFMKCLVKPSFGVAYGGDEFVLVLPQTNKNVALEIVQEIRQLMKSTTYLTKKNLMVHMSASYGVATYPDDAIDSMGLLALADEAMFHVKSSGKDAIGTSRDSE